MPLYTYKCSCGRKFEDLNRMSERHRAECIHCGRMAPQIITPTQLDPNMDTPGAKMVQRKKMEARGRGKDMWSGNRECADDGILRDAYEQRKARGETSITTNGKKGA